MKQQNIEFLDANRNHYTTLVNAGFIQHLDQATRQRILDIIHEEFNPGYIASLWCQSCIADMLKYCYVQYDKWIAAQPVQEPVSERDHVRMTFPIQEEPTTEAKEILQVDPTLFDNKNRVQDLPEVPKSKHTVDPVPPKRKRRVM